MLRALLLCLVAACASERTASSGGSGGGDDRTTGGADTDRSGDGAQPGADNFLPDLFADNDPPGGDRAASDDDRPAPQTRWAQLIRRSPYPKLIVEVDSVPGMEPRTSSESAIDDVLTSVVDKPGGVTVQRDDALTSQGTNHAWSFDELSAMAIERFDLPTPVDTIAIHTMFVDGHYDQDTSSGSILGIAWSYRHIVMFKQTIQANCSGNLLGETLCAAAERSIWTHEVGHLLGLVDNGLPMVTNHRDPNPDHGRHDADSDCIMYWAYDGEDLMTLLIGRLGAGEPDIGFDQACLDDVNAIRNL